MQIAPHARKHTLYLLRLLVIVQIVVTVFALQSLDQAGQVYDHVSKALSKESSVVKRVQVGTTELAIPTYDLFHTGNVWAIVSREHPLEGEAGHTLVPIPVAHGDEELPMKVATEITSELERLVNAAEADGEPLMISSAYRSLDEQRDIYNDYVRESGEQLAKLYVLPVGASEHHTGLSVDFSSVSDECAEDSDSCSLSQSAAAWLSEHAATYGFIQRYPEGKQSITGVGFEPWHYRFVGIPLARAMATTDLTLEETFERIAPGYVHAD